MGAIAPTAPTLTPPLITEEIGFLKTESDLNQQQKLVTLSFRGILHFFTLKTFNLLPLSDMQAYLLGLHSIDFCK